LSLQSSKKVFILKRFSQIANPSPSLENHGLQIYFHFFARFDKNGMIFAERERERERERESYVA